jgi:hypothetical protein
MKLKKVLVFSINSHSLTFLIYDSSVSEEILDEKKGEDFHCYFILESTSLSTPFLGPLPSSIHSWRSTDNC